MVADEKLIGWLCIMRHNLDEEGVAVFQIPRAVKEALIEAGWVEVGEKDWDGSQSLHVTSAGCAVTDLAAPEWGIDPVPIEG